MKIKYPDNVDYTGKRYGLIFVNGIAETSDKFIVSHLKAKGFEEVKGKQQNPQNTMGV